VVVSSIQEIKNPWEFRKGVMVYDIETNRDGGMSEEAKKEKIVLCAVVYSYSEDEYYTFTDGNKLVEKLKEAEYLVTYNGEGFDHIVLKKHGLKIRKITQMKRWITIGIKSLDIMGEAQKRRPPNHQGEHGKKYPSLDEMAKSTLNESKGEADHKDIKKLLQYCKKDVEITKRLFESPIWKFPILEKTRFRKYDNLYDDDIMPERSRFTRFSDGLDSDISIEYVEPDDIYGNEETFYF